MRFWQLQLVITSSTTAISALYVFSYLRLTHGVARLPSSSNLGARVQNGTTGTASTTAAAWAANGASPADAAGTSHLGRECTGSSSSRLGTSSAPVPTSHSLLQTAVADNDGHGQEVAAGVGLLQRAPTFTRSRTSIVMRASGNTIDGQPLPNASNAQNEATSTLVGSSQARCSSPAATNADGMCVTAVCAGTVPTPASTCDNQHQEQQQGYDGQEPVPRVPSVTDDHVDSHLLVSIVKSMIANQGQQQQQQAPSVAGHSECCSEDNACGVCLDSGTFVGLKGCSHRICGELGGAGIMCIEIYRCTSPCIHAYVCCTI